MNPEVELCEHLRSVDLAELAIEADDVLDWYDGPITAIARCARCQRLGVLDMLDWSRSHRIRVFALAGLEPQPLAVYRRNVEKGSCDLGRLDGETAALCSCAGPVERLIALDVQTNTVVAAVPRPTGLGLPDAPWRERLLAEEDSSWFDRLGLGKSDS